VRCIHKAVMTPASLAQLWRQLDDVSKKAVASAYHNGGSSTRLRFWPNTVPCLSDRKASGPGSKTDFAGPVSLLALPYYAHNIYNPILPLI